MRIAPLKASPAGLLCLWLLAGCQGNRAELPGRMVDTIVTVAKDLPSGRFQLPTAQTAAPDLWITLPAGYTVKNVGRSGNDEFFVIRGDDPSLQDSAAVTPGFLRIYVGAKAQSALDSTTGTTRRAVVVAGRPLEQTSWAERLPRKKGLYYQREIASTDFFASVSFELARTPLHLHLYAAGSDSAQVSELAAAALTVGFAP